MSVRGCSYKIISDVDITADTEGVLFAYGARFGGPALFIQGSKRHYVYNFLGIPSEQAFVSEALTPGKHPLEMEFVRERAGEHKELDGTTRLYVDDRVVDQGTVRAQVGKFTLCGDRLCVGFDSADALSRTYRSPFTFTGGTMYGVAVDVGEESCLDLKAEAMAVLARE